MSIEEFAFYRVGSEQITEVWGSGFAEQLLQQLG